MNSGSDRPQGGDRGTGRDHADSPKADRDRPEPMDPSNRRERENDDRGPHGSEVAIGGGGDGSNGRGGGEPQFVGKWELNPLVVWERKLGIRL